MPLRYSLAPSSDKILVYLYSLTYTSVQFKPWGADEKLSWQRGKGRNSQEEKKEAKEGPSPVCTAARFEWGDYWLLLWLWLL